MDKKIRVVIVDDSLLFREVLARGISSDPQIEVVAKAANAFDAKEKILKLRPDVVTCDVEMPKMNGIEFIKQLLPQHTLPVIVVSSISSAVFDAMDAGAVDFVTKPDIQSPNGVEFFILDLIAKIKIAAHAKVRKPELITRKRAGLSDTIDTEKIIAIGASTGGTEAIFSILKQLPQQMPGMLIVQHIPPMFSRMFAERLNNQTPFLVKEVQGDEYIEPGKVLVAPGDKHMVVKKIGTRYKVQVYAGEKVNGHCPSVDVLFESVARECRSNAVGLILTGMGSDGARGMLSMRRSGARTIGQDEMSCVVYGMPKVAFEIGSVERQAPLDSIPQVLCSMLRQS